MDKLINIYSQDANDAIKTIYQSRKGPNSLPTPDHSQSSSRGGLDDDSLLGNNSPVTTDEDYSMSMRYSPSSSPPVRSRTRLPNKTSRQNRSLPNFSPFLNLGGGQPSTSTHSPGASISPTYSNRLEENYLSTNQFF